MSSEADELLSQTEKPIMVWEPFGNQQHPIEVEAQKLEAISELLFENGKVVYEFPPLKDRRVSCM